MRGTIFIGTENIPLGKEHFSYLTGSEHLVITSLKFILSPAKIITKLLGELPQGLLSSMKLRKILLSSG